MFKIRHTLTVLMFGQLEKYNPITVEFECKDRIVKIKKASTVTMTNFKGEQTVFVN